MRDLVEQLGDAGKSDDDDDSDDDDIGNDVGNVHKSYLSLPSIAVLV